MRGISHIEALRMGTFLISDNIEWGNSIHANTVQKYLAAIVLSKNTPNKYI